VQGRFVSGHAFRHAIRAALRGRLHRLLQNSTLSLILGGAAVHRCDNRLVFSAGFSR
jgi:hypothetical protein